MGVSQNQGYHFEGPSNKDYSILGSRLGAPYIGIIQGMYWDNGKENGNYYWGLGFRV